MWRRVGGVSRKSPPPQPLGRAPCCLVPGGPYRSGPWGLWDPHRFLHFLPSRGFQQCWGKIKEVREGQGLDSEAAEITKKPKPRGGNPLLLWGVTVTLEMAGKLPVKYLKWTRKKQKHQPNRRPRVIPCTPS